MLENTGNIGKSYRKHDEVGTPICITIDFDTLENKTITVRDRDTMVQTKANISEAPRDSQKYFGPRLKQISLSINIIGSFVYTSYLFLSFILFAPIACLPGLFLSDQSRWRVVRAWCESNILCAKLFVA